ncbi:MAG: hypothetical protein H0T79_06825 [Deltaproteobacteria bacterium]|nr:hypothetical protein [Deltaproteobacteria bacterium]
MRVARSPRAVWLPTHAATWLIAFNIACSGPPTNGARSPGDHGEAATGEVAEDDDVKPTYSPAELGRALIAERGLEAIAERVVADHERADHDLATSEPMRVAVADLAVRRRFIATLESCQASGRWCPPRLDERPFAFELDPPDPRPPLDTPLRFDLTTWRTLTAELHGRACACRTIACVDAIGVAIDQLEPEPTREVQGDELASDSLTRARQCLFRLRGTSPAVRVLEP